MVGPALRILINSKLRASYVVALSSERIMFTNNTNITLELQAMIDRLAEGGGGEIVIPPGEYGFSPIRLASNICLTISAGAKLTASPDRADYFLIGYDHNEMGPVTSAIYAMDAVNVTLRGEGTIDLNGLLLFAL